MAQTRHRSIKTDFKSNLDEIEQALHIKAHRAAKKKVVEFEFEDDDFDDEELYAEVEYLLRKNR